MVKEQELIQEIQYYKDQIGKTQSKQRQWQLYRHIYKLEKELKIYKKFIKTLYKTKTRVYNKCNETKKGEKFMENNKSVFDTLYGIEVNEHTEQKNGLTYLSWAWAWKEVKERYPDANYTIYERDSEYGAINYFTDGRTCWVKTGVTINGLEHIEYLPVMDFRNKSIPLDQVTSFDVNKAIQRSLTKAVARHGLGLYIYAGEDLPEGAIPKHWNTELVEKTNELEIDFDKLALYLGKEKYKITNEDLSKAIAQKERMNKKLDVGDVEV